MDSKKTIMLKKENYILFVGIALLALMFFSSCERFFNPDQELNIREDQLYDNWYEYRSVEMGLYALQADLSEQLVILGELRGDLLKVTDNAEPEMIEIYNFNVSPDNKYASPLKFFRLISACNNFINILENKHPEILLPEGGDNPLTNYDKLYGEVLCMRAWAYFSAVRIYGKIPFIPVSLTTIEEIDNFLSTEEPYLDSVHITYGVNGWDNDTAINEVITLEKQFYDEKLVIDHFTYELENNVKEVGVNHYSYNNDMTWEVTIWNKYAMHALLGSMYLTDGDLANAVHHFEEVVMKLPDNRYQLDNTFSKNDWQNIFADEIDISEHIYTLWFNQSNFQKNRFQEIFDIREPHKYMLQPTKRSVVLWESLFDNYKIQRNDAKPSLATTTKQGSPGDFYRGHGVSYAYYRDGAKLNSNMVRQILGLKAAKEFQDADALLGTVDTVVLKYSLGKNRYAEDANFIVYRAAGIHLWLAEAYVHWKFNGDLGLQTYSSIAEDIVNDGKLYGADRDQMGVRGRVGFGDGEEGIHVYYINYIHDPETNEIIDYVDVSGTSDDGLRFYLEGLIIDERARELAFEGERFYDLMRIAKRRNDPSYLAELVSQKFPAGKREEIYNLLLDEENWYIPYFE